MSNTTKKSAEALARLGIHIDTPGLIVEDEKPFIEQVSASDLSRLAADEAFMNERVKIRIGTTTNPNDPPYATLTVNDVHNRVQVPRGQPTWVKRLHVEVLAHMVETRYTQAQRNPMDPEGGNNLIPHNAHGYQFEVLEDKNPAGRAWLEHLLAAA